jgi:hypothetical protein
MTQKKQEKLTIYEATTLLINKENRFEKDNSALVLKHFGALVEFSAQYTKVYNRVKATNEKGFNKALDIALKNEGDDFYQVVKKCTPNHFTAMRKLGENPNTTKQVITKKIAECNEKKKPIKFASIRGMSNLMNPQAKPLTWQEIVTNAIDKVLKAHETVSKKDIADLVASHLAPSKIDAEQNKQLSEIEKEVAKDMQLVVNQ